MKKFDNSNTPVQGGRMEQIVEGITSVSEEGNITHRKQLMSGRQSASPSFSGDMGDDAIVKIIRREIQQSVAEAVESAVKMYFSKEFEEIKSELSSLREIQKSVEFLSSECDRVNSNMKDLQGKLASAIKENLSLSNQIMDISDRLNLMEQHSREMNIEINGVPENKSENLLSLTRQLCSSIAVPLQDVDVISGVRVRKMMDTNDRPRSIIIKLQSTLKRDQILAAVSKFNKKNTNDKLNSSHLGYGGNKSPVARKVARELGYKYIWVRNGRIFVRKEDHTPAKQIKSFDTLNSL
ncbi:hypothetical protein ACJJTC_004397 [Scirpophaga incertulas]